MAHGMDAVDPGGQRGHVADAGIGGGIKRLLWYHGGGIMRAFDMHAAGGVHLGRVDLQTLGHPFGQGAELHLIEETHHRLGLGVLQLKAVQGDIQGHVTIELHQTARDADLFGIVEQGFAPLGLLDLARAGQERIQIAVFLDQQGGGFQPDPRRARHVVDRISGQGLHIDHAVGGDAELFEHLIKADALVLHRVKHIDAVTDQLHQVLVGRDDRHRPPGIAGAGGQGGDDVISLIALNLDAGHVKGAGGLSGKGKLRAQILGQFGAIGLVGGVDVVAKGLGACVKDHRDMGRRFFAGMGQFAPEKVAKPRHRAHRHAVRFARQRRQRVIGAEDEGRPIDQMQMIALAECHDPPPLFSDMRHKKAARLGRASDQKGHAARLMVVVRVVAVNHEPLVAIAAFDKAAVVRNGQPNARMAQSALTPIAGHFPCGDGLGLGGGARHVWNLWYELAPF